MRLIDTRTGLFHWVDRPTEVPYAILSHVWDGDRELSFHALSRAHAEAFRSPDTLESNPNMIFDRIPGKVRDFCVFAREQGYAFVWVDTCCIDKSSSAELSEAINSMYAWYQQASVCYAYLYDVTARGAPHSSFQAHQQLSDSQWHKRGWTLQELIAPRTVVFLSRDWRVVGTKDSLAYIIKTITGIDTEILSHQTPLSSVSVARRMSWASRRVTRRIEDRAYSLMGIFGIHMPTIYGEGRYAFVRLQEEILKQLPDQTLFVWGPRVFFPDWSKASLSTAPALPQPDAPLLAFEPDAFKPEGKNMELVAVSHSKLAELVGIGNLPLPRYAITGYGTRARLPTLPVGGLPHREDRLLLALLGCLDGDNRVLALVLRREHRGSQQFGVGARVESSTTPYAGSSYARLAVLTLQQLEAVRDDVCVQDVYISHRLTQAPSASPGNLSEVATVVCKWPYETSNTLATIQVAPWSLEMLTELGYKVDGAMPRTSTAPADSDGLLEVSLIGENIQLRISIVPCCFQPVPHPRVYSVRHKRLRAEVSYVWHDFSPPSGHLVAIDASDGELSHSPDEPPCQHSRSHHATHWTRVATTDAVQATFSFLKSQDEPPTGPGRTPPLWGRLRLTLRSMPDQRRVTGWEMEEDAPVFRMMLDVELMEERPQWTWGRDVPGVGRVRLGEDWTACDSESDPGSESEPENEVGRQPSRAAGGDSFEITRLMQSTSQMGFGRAGC
ncbi:heterokaryon incompatibility protein-domain-containing protein [Ganoderma leucocontextum]|nr:heterokaryon incompatibility protein-domain-containing protein [Ganoderma leucocontextum]